MISKTTIKTAALSAVAVCALSFGTQAQDIHFTQFSGAPLTLNPAFTGGFNGQWRAAAIYRDQWRSVTPNAFRTYAVSFDMPLIHDLSIDDYLAGGIQLYNDRAGDGNLQNFSVLGSVAYHKFFGPNVNQSLSIGFQGGYVQKSFDLSRLYFGDQYFNGEFQQVSQEPGFNTKDDYFIFNAGIGWSQAATERFGYTIGIGANNINQPRERFSTIPAKEAGLGIRYTAQLGAIMYTGERFSLRPGVLFQTQQKAQEIVAGLELHQVLGDPEIRSVSTAIFLGGWYRVGDAVMANVGVEFGGFRVGVSYDYNISDLDKASKGNGGFEISLRYIAPSPLDFAKKLVYPCARF